MSAAQSAIITGKKFARHYIHSGMIGLDGEKMSKSRGNLVFVSKLVEQGAHPMAIRWALLDRHYQEETMWTDSRLKEASLVIERLQRSLAKIEVAPTDSVIEGIINALATNLDSKRALVLITQWIENTEAGEVGGNAGELSRALDALLGLAL